MSMLVFGVESYMGITVSLVPPPGLGLPGWCDLPRASHNFGEMAGAKISIQNKARNFFLLVFLCLFVGG